MQTTIAEHLLTEIESFLAASGMAPSRFGLETLSDGALVRQLRDGSRSLTVKNADRVLNYIREQRRNDAPDVPFKSAE